MLVLLRPSNLAVLNEVVHLMLVLIVERWDAYEHLINQNTEGPPIEGVVMTRSIDHFGSYRGQIKVSYKDIQEFHRKSWQFPLRAS